MVIRCLISAMDEIALTPSEARKEPEALFPCASSASSAHQYAANARWPVGGRSVAGGQWFLLVVGGRWRWRERMTAVTQPHRGEKI